MYFLTVSSPFQRILDQCVTTEGDQNKLEYKVKHLNSRLINVYLTLIYITEYLCSWFKQTTLICGQLIKFSFCMMARAVRGRVFALVKGSILLERTIDKTTETIPQTPKR